MNIKFSIFQRSFSIDFPFKELKKWQMPNDNWQFSKGFSLVELLASIAIFSVIGVIVISILTLTLRGSNKADLTESLRQNGDIVLSKIVRSIRYAKSIDDPICVPSATSSAITLTTLTDQETTLSCNSDGITLNSLPLIDTKSILVRDCSFVCRQPTLTDSPTVTVQFILSSNNTSNFFEQKASIPFQATVMMRNLNR
jgi:prepilin-type N-terminal cleavage/methylation domain-containing protein